MLQSAIQTVFKSSNFIYRINRYAYISQSIFKIISSEFGLESITHYIKPEIQNKILNLNGKIIANYNMKQMEKQRTNENQYFKNDKSGWIEVCHAVI